MLNTVGLANCSVEDALLMIQTEESDVKEDISDSSDEDFDPYSEETEVDSDTEVGEDSGEVDDEDVPAHEPQQVSDLDTDTEMGKEIEDFRAVFTDDWTDNFDFFPLSVCVCVCVWMWVSSCKETFFVFSRSPSSACDSILHLLCL